MIIACALCQKDQQTWRGNSGSFTRMIGSRAHRVKILLTFSTSSSVVCFTWTLQLNAADIIDDIWQYTIHLSLIILFLCLVEIHLQTLFERTQEGVKRWARSFFSERVAASRWALGRVVVQLWKIITRFIVHFFEKFSFHLLNGSSLFSKQSNNEM